MANHGSIVAIILLSRMVATCYGAVSFSSLNQTLIVDIINPSPIENQVLKAGEDSITVTWSYNTSFPAGTDADYQTVKLLLCYAPISQKERGWRKTEDHLNKDKTCQHKLVIRPYSRSNNTFTYTIKRDIPTATYFIRAYAINSQHHEAGYGQTTNKAKATDLFNIEGITGRHVSLDIASACFSAFSVLSLFGFFYMEKRKGKKSASK